MWIPGRRACVLPGQLPDLNLSILTSAPNVALEVCKRYKPTVNLIGGLINRPTLSVSGMQSLEFIKNLNFDIAFMVASAFSPENGCTSGNYGESELKHHIIGKANRVIVLCDSSKFGKSMPFTFAVMEDIDILITECKPSDAVLALAEKSNTLVLWE